MSLAFIGSGVSGNVFKEPQRIGTKVVQAQGVDINGNNDDFFFFEQTIASNSYLSKRFEIELYTENGFDDGEWSNGWTKFGIMVREKMTSSSKHFSVLLSPANGVHSFLRSAEGGPSSIISGDSYFRGGGWLKIERFNNKFRGSYRKNPTSDSEETFYKSFAEIDIGMSGDVHVGISLSSQNTPVKVKFLSFKLQVNSFCGQ
jgi:hypothetical protein